jgi:hypothetical protein
MAPPLLILSPNVNEWSAPHPCLFTTGILPSMKLKGGWVGSRASLDTMGKRKISCPYWESKSVHPAHSLVAILADINWKFTLREFFFISFWGKLANKYISNKRRFVISIYATVYVYYILLGWNIKKPPAIFKSEVDKCQLK